MKFIAISLLFLLGLPGYTASTWTAPVDITTSGINGLPIVDMNGNGDTLLIWLTTSPFMVQAASLSFGGNWSIPTTISSTSNPYIGDVAIDPTGNGIAVLPDSTTPDMFSTQANTYTSGSWLANTVQISSLGLNNTGIIPHIGMDDSGNGVAIWGLTTSGRYTQVQSKTYNGSSWGSLNILSTGTDNTEQPQIAVAPTGKAIAVWLTTSIGIQGASYNGTSWSLPAATIASSSSFNKPVVAISSPSTAIAAWLESTTSIQTALYNGTSWETAGILVTGTNLDNPQIAMSGAGNGVIVYSISDGTNSRIASSIYTAASDSWSSPVYISQAGQNASIPQVAMNDEGEIVAVWKRSNGTNTIIQSASSTFGGVWDAPVDLSAAGADGDAPQITLNSEGEGVAVWARGTTIQSSTLVPEPTPPPPVNSPSQRAFRRPANIRSY